MEEKEAKFKRRREQVKETRVNESEVKKKEARLEVRIIAKQKCSFKIDMNPNLFLFELL